MATSKGKSMTVPFIVEKETPGTIRFKEVGDDKAKHKIGTLYVKKGTIDELGGNVKGLQVTLTVV